MGLIDKNMQKWLEQWPKWSETDMADLRDQFNSFDLNSDGMIDLYELSIVLDRLGDTTDEAARKRHFDAVDAE